MRIKGFVGKQLLHILVDSGSTHNFVDLQKAKRLGCRLQITCPFSVAVSGGTKMISNFMCRGFTWTLQGHTFMSDVLILLMGVCEMVLGIQWLATLGNIQWNFEELSMEFVYKGKKIALRGSTQPVLKWMSGK